MNKIERVAAALAGAEVDREPISFWGHSYLKEWSAEELAKWNSTGATTGIMSTTVARKGKGLRLA